MVQKQQLSDCAATLPESSEKRVKETTAYMSPGMELQIGIVLMFRCLYASDPLIKQIKFFSDLALECRSVPVLIEGKGDFAIEISRSHVWPVFCLG